MKKHRDEVYTATLYLDRATPTSAAGTGQLGEGETLQGTPTVTVAKKIGRGRIDVTSEFIAGDVAPSLALGNTAITVKLKQAGAGEQLETAEPYELKAECSTNQGHHYVVTAELRVVATASV